MSRSVYLAGPQVFFPNVAEVAGNLKALCAAHGLTGVFPLNDYRLNDGLCGHEREQSFPWDGPHVDQTRKLFRCEREASWPGSQKDAADREHGAGQPDIDADSGKAWCWSC